MIKGMTMADWQDDYGVEVSELFTEAYEGYVLNEDAAKVSTFTWSNNDDDVIAGMKAEIYTAVQNIFLGADVAEEMAKLDQLWADAEAALGQSHLVQSSPSIVSAVQVWRFLLKTADFCLPHRIERTRL